MKKKYHTNRWVVFATVLLLVGIIAINVLYSVQLKTVIEERDEQLFSLAHAIDSNLVHKLEELTDDLNYGLSRNEYAAIEKKLKDDHDFDEINQYFSTSHLFEQSSLEGVVIFDDQYNQLYSLNQNDLSNDRQYTFLRDEDNDSIYFCYDQFGKYSVALEQQSANKAFWYYVLVDLNHFYDSIVPEKLQASNWVVFYDRGSGVLLQNHDNQDAWLVLDEEAIMERQDGYSIILKNVLADKTGAETYYWPNYYGKNVPERIITLPQSMTQNGYFTIGISRDSEALYKRLDHGRILQFFLMFLFVASGIIFARSVIQYRLRIRSTLADLERQKNEKALLEAQMKEKELKSALKEAQMRNSIRQLQPHFLYNALSSIREIVLESPEYGADMLMDFTNFLRACLKAMSTKELIPFSQELKNIKAYVNIEKMRLGDRLTVVYDIQEDDFLIIPLGVQPLVENAIRHGISKKRNKTGTVAIRTYRENGQIVISVEDDGTGFDVPKILDEIASGKRDSTGISNLKMRFANRMNATLEGTSEVGKGTVAYIKIPLEDSLGGNDESSNS
ncbi:MAG: histidine kinase [Lachnospiraceae bacterium]|nr:histidine kinase [Lachnospiraceae bacterium]